MRIDGEQSQTFISYLQHYNNTIGKMPHNKSGGGYKNNHKGRQRGRNYDLHSGADTYVGDDMMCLPIDDDVSKKDDPFKGLRLRMWDFAQCDPKRCTGARLARRGILQTSKLG